MRRRLFQSAMCSAAILAGSAALTPAEASLVVIPFTGVITGANTDASTLAGVSGSLLGYAISGTISYDSSAMGTPGPQSTANYNYWDTTDGSLAADVMHVSETINGNTFSFSGTYYGALLLANAPGAYPYGTASQALEAVSEDSTPYGVNAAEFDFVSNDPSSDLMNPSLNPAGPFDTSVALESNFYFGAFWNTPTLSAQWQFQTTEVPEPPAIGLLAAGLATLAVTRRRLRGVGAPVLINGK